MSANTCGKCCHFDAIHQLCPLFTIDQSVGKYYLKRLPESPACASEFLADPKIQVAPHPFDVDYSTLKK